VIQKEDLRDRFMMRFNDADPKNARNLELAIRQTPGISGLTHQPIIENRVVDSSVAEELGNQALPPTFSFVDPWGYKGVSLKLVRALTKDWGCDCVIFYNYNRINAAIANDLVQSEMCDLFTTEGLLRLRKRLDGCDPRMREYVIIEEQAYELRSAGCTFVLPFRFTSPEQDRTSHYLLFVSKSAVGYKIMKEIMAKESSSHDDGVASFGYVPVQDDQLTLLFGFNRPLDSLGADLVERFCERELTVKQIFDLHNVGTPFVMPNYQSALKRLEQDGRISADPPRDKRPKRRGEVTFSENVRVKFP
jgi:three-Cys-motif partner protein